MGIGRPELGGDGLEELLPAAEPLFASRLQTLEWGPTQGPENGISPIPKHGGLAGSPSPPLLT